MDREVAGYLTSGSFSSDFFIIFAFASPAAIMIPVVSGLWVIVPNPIVMTSLFLLISIPPRSVAAAACVSKFVVVSLVVELWSDPLTLKAICPSRWAYSL